MTPSIEERERAIMAEMEHTRVELVAMAVDILESYGPNAMIEEAKKELENLRPQGAMDMTYVNMLRLINKLMYEEVLRLNRQMGIGN